jgi:glycosyltransferase involved in cell wall biosynthesis
MPCFNAEAHVATGVASALDQSFQDIELIIVNDGSTDNTLKIVKGIDDKRLKVVNQPNRGVCAARNRGLAEAKAHLIAFLDSDDTWHPQCLEKLYAALESSPKAVLAYCGWQNVGLPGGRGKPFVPRDYEQSNKIETLLRDCPWPIHAALTRRNVIEETGGFDIRFATSEDYYLWLKIATKYPIVRVPEVLAYYHFHDAPQATKNRAREALDNWKVKCKFLNEKPEVKLKLGRKRVRELTHGHLLKKGYICYWNRDLRSARKIFRLVMKTGYGTVRDWKYMLPALLPINFHRFLIKTFTSAEDTN